MPRGRAKPIRPRPRWLRAGRHGTWSGFPNRDFRTSPARLLTWNRTAATRGTQMIFSDMGVNPTPWGYSPYEEIITKLVAHGIPREQIAAIGDAESDAKKQALFEKVRNGSVGVLIGSTQKMGTG